MKTSWKITLPLIILIVLALTFGYFFFVGQEKSAQEMIVDQNLLDENNKKIEEPKTLSQEFKAPVATGNIDDIINATMLFSEKEQSLADQEVIGAVQSTNDNKAVNSYLNTYEENEY